MNVDEEQKMWLAVRIDLTMPSGKLAVQSGHGFATALLDAFREDPERVGRYQRDAMPKVVVRVSGERELLRVRDEARAAGIPHAFVVDAGRTVFTGPTPTVCAFGPRLRSELPPFLRRLRLHEDKPAVTASPKAATPGAAG